jgi:hypothetical protein
MGRHVRYLPVNSKSDSHSFILHTVQDNRIDIQLVLCTQFISRSDKRAFILVDI